LYPSNHPLNLIFDDKGVCSGCLVHDEKYKINWNEKLNKLKKIVRTYKSKNFNYDCIVPVSGGKDSFYILDIVKNKLRLNPLIVSYNKHYNTETGIKNLAYLKTVFDCDSVVLNVNPLKVKKITKKTFFEFGSIYWHILAGQSVLPVRKAVELKIPLIIWGAHQGIDQVGMFSHHNDVEMTRKYRKNHDLMGYEAEDLENFNLTKSDLEEYYYPSNDKISEIGVRGIYLNNYFFWDSKKQHEQMIKLYNYSTRKQFRTIDNYNDVDCFHYSSLHDYIKYLKYGYSKINDHLTRDIRLKKISRNESLNILKKYVDLKPKIAEIKLFSKWIGVSTSSVQMNVDKQRNLLIWKKDKSNWKLRYPITKLKIKNKLMKQKYSFNNNPLKKKLFKEDEYILYHKGFKPLLDL